MMIRLKLILQTRNQLSSLIFIQEESISYHCSLCSRRFISSINRLKTLIHTFLLQIQFSVNNILSFISQVLCMLTSPRRREMLFYLGNIIQPQIQPYKDDAWKRNIWRGFGSENITIITVILVTAEAAVVWCMIVSSHSRIAIYPYNVIGILIRLLSIPEVYILYRCIWCMELIQL